MPELITHSRQDCFKTCRKKAYYSYELGLRKIVDAKALRMGSAFHEGVDQLGQGQSLEEACESIRDIYAVCPEGYDSLDWYYEQETILRLICGYQWRWSENAITTLHSELPFEIPLINPQTGKPTPTFHLAGKIDAIVRLEDQRLAVKETKLLGDDISQESNLWRRMRLDHQVSLYTYAARTIGHPVDTVLYDVARKPIISATNVPLVDDDGIKIVRNANGERVKNANGKWRQTGDKDLNYEIQSRPMTVEEWGNKLADDIYERPTYYFQRIEIPRLDHQINEYLLEMWDIQQTIREAQRNNKWYRTVNKNTCPYCPYFDICERGDELTSAPHGFQFVSDKHPELKGKFNGQSPHSKTNGVPTAVTHSATASDEGSYW